MAAPAGPVTEILEAAGIHAAVVLARIEERLAAIGAGGGPDLSAHASGTIAAGGKRLRPLLVVLSAGEDATRRAAQADGVPALVRAGVAVELVHSATLVHDDVLDVAALRRGKPTVFAAAGRAAATATGDLLFARAFRELVDNGSADQIRALSAASSALAQGELLQRADAWNPTVTVDRYLLRCELKTAALFEAACELGALEGGVEPAPLGAFGRLIGIAFQILDDVLDVSGPAERTGKHRGTDLLDGTVTLPLILARAADPSLAALEPRSITTAQRAAQICDRIAATGVLEEARTRAHELVAQAVQGLPDELPPTQRSVMEKLAAGVVERYA
jgi:geranylgeranyl pyrophosphate synthase